MEKALFCNNLIKKITAALMIVMLLIPYCFAQVTFGDNKSDLKNAQNQQNDIQNKKKETEDKIAQLKAQSSDLTSLIQGLDAQMGELSASLDDINTQIATLEAEIEETQAQLEQAEADKESQYEAMKLRIQFMYEHNDYTYVEVLLSSQSMADMLNKFEYINKISEYDRQMLEEYQSTINLISSSKVKLEEDKGTLTASQEALQAQVDALEVVRELRRAGINENIGNINAVNELMATGQLMAYTRKHGNQGSKSIYGENIIDSNDKLKEVLDSRDKLEAMYTNLEEAAGDELEEAIESSLTGTAEDPVD